MRFDITDLRLFAAVCRAGTITAGAAEVGLALPSASQRLGGMEDAAGARFLERGRDGVRPTAAGQALLGHAAAVVARWDEMRLDLGLDGGRGGRVRLAANTAALATIVAVHLPGFLAAHPGIAVEVLELASERVLAAVADGTADLGIALASAMADPAVERRLLGSDPLVVALPRQHPLARRRRVRLAELAASPFVALPADSPLQRFLDRHAGAGGFCPGVRVRLADPEALCRMVEQGVGAAVLPRALVRARPRRLSAPLLADAWADRRLTLCRPRNRTLPGGVRRLADHLLAGDAPAPPWE
ncbi:LysR family transcriptional regulator [Stella sp.]|uniref:LysR family transcriptional regulator n=1 Tax=Stella sp. TaxID=2912054 RepID=UPI0035B19027